MSKFRFRLPPCVRDLLTDLGVKATVEKRAKHFALVTDGKVIGQFHQGSRDKATDYHAVKADIRRYAKNRETHGQAQ